MEKNKATQTKLKKISCGYTRMQILSLSIDVNLTVCDP